MTDFSTELSLLTTREMTAAQSEPERMATMFERLINSAGFTIAMMAEGDPNRMGELLAGAEAYLYESAAGHAEIARFLGKATRSGS